MQARKELLYKMSQYTPSALFSWRCKADLFCRGASPSALPAQGLRPLCIPQIDCDDLLLWASGVARVAAALARKQAL